MCFGSGDIETKEVPLMSPEQQKMLSQLLSGTMSAMKGFPLGQAYGGPVESSWQPQPFMAPNTMRRGPIGPGQMPGQMPGQGPGNLSGGNFGRPNIQPAAKGKGMGPGAGGIQNRPGGVQGNANLMANLLAGPMPNTMTQGMTGNFPKRPGGRR